MVRHQSIVLRFDVISVCRTIVHWAAAKGHAAILEDILSFCSRAKYLVNVTESITGWTALHVRWRFRARLCVKFYLGCSWLALEAMSKLPPFC